MDGVSTLASASASINFMNPQKWLLDLILCNFRYVEVGVTRHRDSGMSGSRSDVLLNGEITVERTAMKTLKQTKVLRIQEIDVGQIKHLMRTVNTAWLFSKLCLIRLILMNLQLQSIYSKAAQLVRRA